MAIREFDAASASSRRRAADDPARAAWVLRYEPPAGREEGLHEVCATDPRTGQEVGWLYWDEQGCVRNVGVLEQYARLGVATAMLRFAWTLPVPAPSHAVEMTDAGRAWAAAVRPYEPG